MHNETYIWLGSRRARRKGANAAAVQLDLARNARLPVPAGIVLLDEAWHFARRQEWLAINGSHVQFKAPDFARELIMAASFDRPVRVTPSRLPLQPNLTAYHHAVAEPDDFATAVAATWSQMLSFEREAGDRLDLLVTEAVAATRRGTAASAASYAADLVWEEPDFTVQSLPQLDPGGEPHQEPAYRRLQQLLRGVRRSLGNENWLIEWGDDGNICWLLGMWTLPPHWQRAERFVPWLEDVSLPAGNASRAAQIWAEELGDNGGRLPLRLDGHVVELNVSLLEDFWRGLGFAGGWDSERERFVPAGAGRFRFWHQPTLYARSLYWRSRLATWFEAENKKPHSQTATGDLAMRAFCRYQLASLTGEPPVDLAAIKRLFRQN